MELSQGPAVDPQGQPASDPASAPGTTGQEPMGSDGQAAGQGSAGTGQATGTQISEETFFDPSKLPPELMSAYKQMQGAFTKKLQGFAQNRRKIEAYDQFERDPVGTLQQIAGNMGYQLTRAEARQMVKDQQQGAAPTGQIPDDWQPKNWGEVMQVAEARARESLMREFAPILQGVQGLQAQNIESQLDRVDPNWRMYEDEMRDNLRDHPTLVKDVAKLYRMSVPEEVYSSKAVQAAISKLEKTAEAAKMGGKSQTSKSVATPQGVKTFDDAVAFARTQVQQTRR